MNAGTPVFTVSTNDLAPLFSFLTLLITTGGAVALAFIAYLQAKIVRKTDINTEITKQTRESTNHKMDELMALIAEASEAKGRLHAIQEMTSKDKSDDETQ